MRSSVILFLLFIAVVGNTFSKTYHTQRKTNHSFYPDTSRYAIFKFEEGDSVFFKKGVKATELTSKEIEKIEKLIKQKVSEYNNQASEYNKSSKGFQINNPSKYYKQLIAVINVSGEKEVWVNCLCYIDDKSRFKRDIIGMLDGGVCYFNLKINLTRSIAYDLIVNGVG